MKICNRCNSPGEFRADPRNKDGLQGICRDCQRSYQREFNKEWNADPVVKLIKRDYRLANFWPGSTKKEAGEKYNTLFQAQNGCCAICETHQSELNKALAVDHDHKTGEVRGLLCGNCNRGIGIFKENQSSLSSAIKYLNKFNAFKAASNED